LIVEVRWPNLINVSKVLGSKAKFNRVYFVSFKDVARFFGGVFGF